MLVAKYTSNTSGFLPTFNSDYNYTVTETVSNGVCTVEINSDTDFSSVTFGNTNDSSSTEISQLLTVEYLKVTNKVTSLASSFRYCTNLQSINTVDWDTSNVTTLYATFHSCNALTNLDVSNWDTSNVTSLYYTFYNCNALTNLDVSNWDTSNVTSLHCTFYNCNALTSLDVSNWDTSNVNTLYATFHGCKALTNLDVSNWDTSKVTSLRGIFYSCNALTNLDVSNWDTSKVTTLYATFHSCKALTNLDVSNWDTSKVTSLHGTFHSCNALTNLDVSNWDTSKVTTLESTFQNCTSLTQLDLSNFNINSSAKLTSMFANCSGLKDIGMVYCDQYTVDTVAANTYNTEKTIWVKEGITQKEIYNQSIYKVYKENSKKITLNEPLRAIGNIKDKFIKRNGKWYVERNCGEFTIKSSTPINIEVPSETAAIVSIDRVYVNNMKVDSGITLLICSDFKSENNYSAPYYTYINPTNIAFTLPLTANTSSKAHEILDGTKFVYLLEQPIYEEIEDPTVFILSENINILNTSSIPSNMIIQNTSYAATGVKPNTQYTVISDNPVQGVYLCGTEISMNSNTILVTTPRELADNHLIFYGTGEVGNIMLIEGDYRNNDFEYFTGSVEVGKTASGKYTFVEDEE